MMASPGNHQDGSLPLPVSITLYNRFPPLEEDDESAPKSKLFRPDYTVNLLVSLRLEIYSWCDDQGNEERIIYTFRLDHSGAHPVWDHLNERIEDWQNNSVWEEQSESIFMRIVLINEQSRSGETLLVNSLPLHPNSLRRLPKHDDESMSSKLPPPPKLPPNAVLIHYTDGLMRVAGSLYHVLMERGVISEDNPGDVSLRIDDDEEAKRRSRFEDDIFDVLDTVTANSPGARSLLETDNVLLATPVRQVRDDDYDDLKEIVMPTLIDTTEDDVLQEDLRMERDQLLAQIAAEEALLQEEQEELKAQGQHLQNTMDAVGVIRQETNQIRAETVKVLADAPELDITISVNQRKLVKELQQIYPITGKQTTELRFWIAGAELSVDLFRGQVHEDEISAALGFLAHSVVLLAKYLNVPLRHRIVCNSSRSAIQDSDGKILPLFLSRVAERPQLERGQVLLHRNVDCLAQSRGIRGGNNEDQQQPQQQQHILVKLRDVYDRVIYGS